MSVTEIQKEYTVETLAQALNTQPSELAKRIKALERVKTVPATTDKVKSETAHKLLAMFQAIAAKQLPAQLPQAPQQEVSEPEYEAEVGRLTIKEMGNIAKQYGVSRSLAQELEQASFERHLQLVFMREQLRVDVEDKVKEAVRTSRLLQEVERRDKESDELELALLQEQSQLGLDDVSNRFGLGVQDTLSRLQQQAEDRAKKELQRRQWLKDLEEGKELPAEAKQDFFVRAAYEKKAG